MKPRRELKVGDKIRFSWPNVLAKGQWKGKVNEMKTNEEKLKEFEEVVKPVIKFLNDNFNPHTSIIIDHDSAELVEGQMAIVTKLGVYKRLK